MHEKIEWKPKRERKISCASHTKATCRETVKCSTESFKSNEKKKRNTGAKKNDNIKKKSKTIVVEVWKRQTFSDHAHFMRESEHTEENSSKWNSNKYSIIARKRSRMRIYQKAGACRRAAGGLRGRGEQKYCLVFVAPHWSPTSKQDQ